MASCFRPRPAAARRGLSVASAAAWLCALPVCEAQDGPPRASPTAVTVTVAPGGRQRFAGLGPSLGNWGRDYQKLSADERDRLSALLWRDLRMTSLRLWLNLDEYAPEPGQRLTQEFRERYIDSGIIADARRHGVTDLLLAPDGMPDYMKVKREGGPQDFALKDESVADYAALIAGFIAQVRDETGVLIGVTGLQNEPNNLDRISPEQIPLAVKALRAALDARGLREVRVITPEAANVDDVYYDTLERVKAEPAAWQALSGVASHSYDMAATDRAAEAVAGPGGESLKDYWMTEASDNGPELPGDALRAASVASRFLNDMNHRVTHWVHFLGFEVPDPRDDATRILAFTPGPLRVTMFEKHDYYRLLAEAFDVGAVFRDCTSSLEGDMTWTYGKKPRLTAAAARNPDGTWAAGLCDFTSPEFTADPDDRRGHPAEAFEVTVHVPEMEDAGEVTFTVRREGPAEDLGAKADEVVMRGGRVTLRVDPLELVTLRSRISAGRR